MGKGIIRDRRFNADVRDLRLGDPIYPDQPGNLKDNFGGKQVRVRGNPKVYAHLMFGLLAIAALQLMRLVT